MELKERERDILCWIWRTKEFPAAVREDEGVDENLTRFHKYYLLEKGLTRIFIQRQPKESRAIGVVIDP